MDLTYPPLWPPQMEHSLSLGDWITNGAYFCVVSMCAPVWEEVGRGDGEGSQWNWSENCRERCYWCAWPKWIVILCLSILPRHAQAIFRGFLLSSLARFMPVGAAVVVSSLLFAMCHFRLQTFLPLLLLGMVFSGIFLYTRNLLPPIMLHSAWNIFVLFNLLFRSY